MTAHMFDDIKLQMVSAKETSKSIFWPMIAPQQAMALGDVFWPFAEESLSNWISVNCKQGGIRQRALDVRSEDCKSLIVREDHAHQYSPAGD